MRFINPIPFVHDIARSREFYEKTLGLNVLEDFGSFVLFETGFAIHEGRALEHTVWREVSPEPEAYGRRNLLLYFEHEDVEAAFEAIAPQVELIHPLERQAWGQRVFRFYDPDGHAIEVGEPQSFDEGCVVSPISTEELDRKFDDGEEDILEYFDLSQARVANPELTRVDFDLPVGVLRQIDAEAQRLGVTRQSLIKLWIAERLSTVEQR
jgi:catechol 2,3-dioxygenase-like lactoylglutathione lyase family enzyme